jgi:hypothetical protein
LKKFALPLLPLFLLTSISQCKSSNFLDQVIQEATRPSGTGQEDTFIAGLKQALDIGTRNAVATVSRENGYFDNMNIKIPLPEKLSDAGKMLRKLGLGGQVDKFILSMNRAAETAAPQAVDIFGDAIGEMTVVDAYGIVKGDEIAATTYFKDRTSENLYRLFKPVVTDSMSEVGVVGYYKELLNSYNSIPFVKKIDMDIEDYVTHGALDGLFFMVGEEEKKIRKDPAARVTELLQKVFGE